MDSPLSPTIDLLPANFTPDPVDGKVSKWASPKALELLENAFQQAFSVVDVTAGEIIRVAADGLNCELYSRLAVCEHVGRQGHVQILDEVSPLLLLAVPLTPPTVGGPPLVGVAAFVTQRVVHEEEISAAARALGVDAERALHWSQGRQVWPPHALLQMAHTVSENIAYRSEVDRLRTKTKQISDQLLNTFDEITLLHRLTLHLSLSGSVASLYRLATDWLAEVIPAECLAIKVALNSEEATLGPEGDLEPLLLTHGELPISENALDDLLARLGPDVRSKPIVMNSDSTSHPTWPTSDIRHFLSVPIREGDRFFGWLLAFNHTDVDRSALGTDEFGTVESSLMTSVAVILGIHSGNIELYREQADFFAGVVRALTSAIDAKDPYTSGHSDRVARLSVCLARQLGCGAEDLNTIYLSGLLHDIGKIGIDDTVLRKAGALTPEEYDHIKTHPELGYRILHGIKQLEAVLPIVLHHHEAWDGHGYPQGLVGEECPRLARIVAVADSIDAMSSDRPYRDGMPEQQLDRILQEGAGKQWDAEVIAAVFAVRDEIRRIGQRERCPLSLDVGTWQPS